MRPLVTERWMLTVGESDTWAPFDFTSSASAPPISLDQFDVPGGAERNPDRERRRLHAADETAAAARAVRPVGHAQLVNAEPWDRRQRPEIFTRQEAHLLGQRHLLHEFADPVFAHHLPPTTARTNDHA